MHMSDALISPAVGGIMLAASAAAGAYCIKRTGKELDQKQVPVMGVMGAFIFAAQMINFSIPMTGSSGHIGGGLLLAAVIGPYAGFLTMAAVLLIQALFFADGGLLAYGCNVFNMAFYTCMLAYPLIYKPFTKNIDPANKNRGIRRIWVASILAAVAASQLGAFSVVLQTLLSGKTQLPFELFVSLMQPIHLAIGAIEGVITASVLTFIWLSRPEIFYQTSTPRKRSFKPVLITVACAALVTGGIISWYASPYPDGLEWAIGHTAQEEITAEGSVYDASGQIQASTAILPDYGFPTDGEPDEAQTRAGTSVSGIVGGAMTLALAAAVGGIVVILKKRRPSSGESRS